VGAFISCLCAAAIWGHIKDDNRGIDSHFSVLPPPYFDNLGTLLMVIRNGEAIKYRKKNCSFYDFLCITGSRLVGYAEPNMTKGKIPPDIPADLRRKIEGLYSPKPVDRVIAVYQIGKMAEKAVPAIPFLVAILGDSALLESPSCVESTGPGKEAAAALIKIGKYSVKPLIVALNYTEPGVGEMRDPWAAKALIAALSDDGPIVRAHAASAMRKITGKNLDEEPAKWQKWWNESKFRRGLWLTLFVQMLRSSKSRSHWALIAMI